jgi:putative redox protein
VRVLARRLDGFAHEVDVEGGHQLLADEPLAAGGTDSGPSPTRMLAASLASCTAITIEMYAERKGWDVGAVEVTVDMGYEGPVPSSFALSVALPRELDDDQRRRILAIAARCPVHQVIVGQVPVTISEHVEPL